MKTWLVWVSDDGKRDDAKKYVQTTWFCDAHDVASDFAEQEYSSSAGEIGTKFNVTVVEILENGAEETFEFEILVEFDPVFSATRVTRAAAQ